MSDARERYMARSNMPRHLDELRVLTGSEVREDELLTVDDTAAVIEQWKDVPRVPKWQRTIPFAERTQHRFRKLIFTLQTLNPSPVYLWTPLSKVCGMLRPLPVLTIRFDFPFDIYEDGIVVLVTGDFVDRMLLDFYEEDGLEVLDLKVEGQNWGQAEY